VIARQLLIEPARTAGTRAGRTAVRRRRARSRRARYAALTRIFATLGALVLVVVIYLSLMANVTRMNYELAKLAEQKANLQEETAAGDDAIANASSNERLKAFAQQLHMREPQTFVAVEAPQPPVAASHGVAFLGWLK
jgi:cell division protein FtsL